MRRIRVLMIFVLVQYSFAKPTSDDRIIFRDDSDMDTNEGILKSDDFDGAAGVEAREIDVTLQAESEMGQHFQGDIILSPEEKRIMLSNDSDALTTRTGLLDEEKRWPKDSAGHVNVFYTIDTKSGYS